jgi:hypothetical protein
MGFFLELAYPQDYAVRNAYFSKYGACIRCVAAPGAVDANKTAFIYPNPNRGAFTVRLPGEFSTGSYLVTLYDSKGAKVFAQSKAFANREANFDLRKLSTGIYMLRVWDLAGKEIRTGKVAIL